MLKIKNGYKNYGSKIIFEQVNVEFQKGNIYAIVGENGCGKSSLFKIIAGVSTMSSGDMINDFDCVEYVDDSYSMVGDHIIDTLSYYKFMDIKFKYSNVLKRISELGVHEKSAISDLSKGQKALVRLIIAQESSSDLILIDELLDGLDVKNRDLVIMSIVKDLSDARTYILIDHNLEELLKLTDLIYYFQRGKLEFVEDIDALFVEYNSLNTWFKKGIK